MQKLIATALAGITLSSPSPAQTVLPSDYSFSGFVCIGSDCTDSETWNAFDDTLRLKSRYPSIEVVDTTTQQGASDDWRLRFGSPELLGADYFAVENNTQNTIPFQIRGGARSASLTVGSQALEPRIGIGTIFPQTELHIASQIVPVLRLEQVANNAPSFEPYVFDIQSTHQGIEIHDETAGTSPFRLAAGAPTGALRINPDGDLGLGILDPERALHLWRDDQQAQVFVEEASAITNPRTLLNLRNNGRAEIVMGNTDTDGEWSFGAGTNFVMKFGAVGSRSPVKTRHLTLYSGTGDLEITGQIITNGPTCKAGCDAVFSDGYDLPSIGDHAAQMYDLGHLPNVGPTRPGEPVNISERYGALLNELEHAHIYIDQLHRDMQVQKDMNLSLIGRLDRLEAAQGD